MSEPIALRFDSPAAHVAVQPGGEIVLRGSLYSGHDGARVDATTTTWPADAPGGASVDPGGLYDLGAGGFHLVSQDPQAHVVHAVATGVRRPPVRCAASTPHAWCRGSASRRAPV